MTWDLQQTEAESDRIGAWLEEAEYGVCALAGLD